MANKLVDIYLADQWVWNGIVNGRPNVAVVPPPPPTRPEARNVVPYVGLNQSWSDTIDKILGDLNRGDLIANFYMMGHGAAGLVTIGQILTWRDDSSIAQFRRLKPFTQEWLTHVCIVGCESAADGPCVPGTLSLPDGSSVRGVCLGQFSGNTGKPGYQLLRKLADAIDAPVSGSTWRLAIADGWTLGAARLTVGPGGGWTYRAVNEKVTRIGSP